MRFFILDYLLNFQQILKPRVDFFGKFIINHLYNIHGIGLEHSLTSFSP